MPIRDIINYAGEVIGTLELPEETTEEQWADALSLYSLDPEVAARALALKVAVSNARAGMVDKTYDTMLMVERKLLLNIELTTEDEEYLLANY